MTNLPEGNIIAYLLHQVHCRRKKKCKHLRTLIQSEDQLVLEVDVGGSTISVGNCTTVLNVLYTRTNIHAFLECLRTDLLTRENRLAPVSSVDSSKARILQDYDDALGVEELPDGITFQSSKLQFYVSRCENGGQVKPCAFRIVVGRCSTKASDEHVIAEVTRARDEAISYWRNPDEPPRKLCKKSLEAIE